MVLDQARGAPFRFVTAPRSEQAAYVSAVGILEILRSYKVLSWTGLAHDAPGRPLL